jgi:vancomycin permeability regulator SanA
VLFRSWIDLGKLPVLVAAAIQLALTVALYAFAFHVPSNKLSRTAGSLLCLLFAILAAVNAMDVYLAAAAGRVQLGFFAPFSAFIALAFVLLAIAFAFGARMIGAVADGGGRAIGKKNAVVSGRGKLKTTITIAITVVILGVLFPMGQLLCFGTTTYNANVDATVVLGAQVLPDGRPSDVLRDRLDTAIKLYNQGKTRILIMSGGIDIGGTNEAEKMRDYAIEQGVPADDILVDSGGQNTQGTARDTVALMNEHGLQTVAAVSDYFHLARIKMLFLDAGTDVTTIPCDAHNPAYIGAVLREVPGWWYYWFVTIVI